MVFKLREQINLGGLIKDYFPTSIIDKQLIELGIQLPGPTPTEFNYIPLSIHDEIVHLAGQIPKTTTTDIRHIELVGEAVEIKDAKEEAGLCVLHGLS